MRLRIDKEADEEAMECGWDLGIKIKSSGQWRWWAKDELNANNGEAFVDQ